METKEGTTEPKKQIPITRQGIFVSKDKQGILPFNKPVKFMILCYDGVLLMKFENEMYTKGFAEVQDDFGLGTIFDETKGFMISEYPNKTKDEIFKEIYWQFKELGADIKLRG